MAIYGKGLLVAGFLAGIYALPVYPLEFEGFGSVSYHRHDAEGNHASGSAEYPEGFTMGGFDLYAFQQIGEKTSAFAEFIIADFEEEIELERLWIKRSFNEALELKAGLVESPLGYWNRTYHHGGQLLQDTITRPFFLRYEEEAGAIFPMVSVGIEVSGGRSFHAGRLEYTAVFANGMSLESESTHNEPSASRIVINTLGDPGDEKLAIVRAAWSFGELPLQVGLFGMNNPVVNTGGELLVSQTVAGSDVHLGLGGFDAIAEYYSIDNRDEAGAAGSRSGNAWYVQLGYQLTGSLKPLYRYSRLGMEPDDAYFGYLSMVEQAQHVLGIRYDIDDSNALKLEYSLMKYADQEDENHLQLQWAFIMF